MFTVFKYTEDQVSTFKISRLALVDVFQKSIPENLNVLGDYSPPKPVIVNCVEATYLILGE